MKEQMKLIKKGDTVTLKKDRIIRLSEDCEYPQIRLRLKKGTPGKVRQASFSEGINYCTVDVPLTPNIVIEMGSSDWDFEKRGNK